MEGVSGISIQHRARIARGKAKHELVSVFVSFP